MNPSDEKIAGIQQDHDRGPGWFLKISYVLIALFCVYYLVTFWGWESDYDKQQRQIDAQISETQLK